MLIKEYRIPLPLTVDEYRIAQRYMIQKKSREESEGKDSGVQFVINEPSTLDDGRPCQYTKKYFFVMRHIPSWLKSILPSSVLSVLRLTEEAWNAYPYTRTKFYSEALTKLNVHVETVYLPDYGNQENVFNLKADELRRRIVELVDVVNDPVDDAEYVLSEDLTKYSSVKTGRGPLSSTWLKEYAVSNAENVDPKKRPPVMCAYKLMKVDCQYWGFQTKVENFLHDSSRKVMLRSHKQAFSWTDEWYDLSMNDILALEYETQRILAEKYEPASSPVKKAPSATSTTAPAPASAPSTPARKRKSSSKNEQQKAPGADKLTADSVPRSSPQRSVSSTMLDIGGLKTFPSMPKSTEPQIEATTTPSKSSPESHSSLQTPKRQSPIDRSLLASPSGSAHSIFDQCLRRDSVADDEEVFYDAFETLQTTSADAGTTTINIKERSLQVELQRCNSLELAQRAQQEQANGDNEGERVVNWQTKHATNFNIDNDDEDTSSSAADRQSAGLASAGMGAEFPRAELLILIFHGGSLLERGTPAGAPLIAHAEAHEAVAPPAARSAISIDADLNISRTPIDRTFSQLPSSVNVYGDAEARRLDLHSFRSTLDTVLTTYYPSLKHKVAVRVVPCPAICAPFVRMLRSLLPFSYAAGTQPGTVDAKQKNMDFSHLSALPLFAVNDAEYRDKISVVIETANQVYQEFLDSAYGIDFDGKVIAVGDSCGALLAYDAICASLNFKMVASSARSPGIVSWDSAASQPATTATTAGQATMNSTLSNSAPIPESTRDGVPTRQVFRYTTTDADRSPSPHALQRSVSPLSTPRAKHKPIQLLTAPPASSNTSSSSSGGGGGGLLVTHRSNSDSRLGMHHHSPLSLLNSTGEATFMPKDYLLFDIGELFACGSPLGLVLAYRLANNTEPTEQNVANAANLNKKSTLDRLNPHCQLYNLYYSTDPSATRIEPLLFPAFARVAAGALPRYEKFPLGDGSSQQIFDVVHANRDRIVPLSPAKGRLSSKVPASIDKDKSSASLPDAGADTPTHSNTSTVIQSIMKLWWGTKRLDYAVYSPDRLQQMPHQALPFLFHASYWESFDVVAFLMRQMFVPAFAESMEVSLPSSLSGAGQQIMRSGHFGGASGIDSNSMLAMRFLVNMPVERWQKRTTYLKIRNMSPNHRANDVIATERGEQVLQARFAYGMLDMASLSGEKIDIYVLRLDCKTVRARHRRKSTSVTAANSAQFASLAAATATATVVANEERDWQFLSTEITDKYGRIQYTLPADKKLSFGQYPVRFVVRGDHTFTDCNIAVMPPGTELVVFSIDGSFTASMSVSGRDPKVRPGAVDIVRHWQELGFLILYISGRPLMQRRNISAWLAQHNFPFGLFHFTDGVAYDPLGQKRDYLLALQQSGFLIHGTYGSSKDVAVYSSAKVSPDKIFVVGKLSRKRHERAVFLKDGYAAHLAQLVQAGGSRPAQGNGRLYVNKGVLPLPADAYVLSTSGGANTSATFPLPPMPSAATGSALHMSLRPSSGTATTSAAGGGTLSTAAAAVATASPLGRFHRMKHHIVRYHSMRHSSNPQQQLPTAAIAADDEKVQIGTNTTVVDNINGNNGAATSPVTDEQQISTQTVGGAARPTGSSTAAPRQRTR